ncbi:MAG TPA: C45 family autoproteolytic acyltransferase/hydrolase [Myxococcota bacterium]|nr:C45 family autoproteolytic acyltransferase/hydrolase [Myxococcota bacterium]
MPIPEPGRDRSPTVGASTALLALVLTLSACGANSEPAQLNGSFLETIDGIRVVHLYGSPAQRGYAQGYLLADEIIELTQTYLFDYALSQMTDLSYAQVRELLEVNGSWPPDVRIELESMLSGIQDRLDPEDRMVTVPGEGYREIELIDLMAGNTQGNWTRIGGCSGFAAWGTATGGPTLHARNMDYASGNGAILGHLLVEAIAPDQGPDWITIGNIGTVGCGSCMNEYGLTMEANNGGDGLAPSYTTGVSATAFVAREAMQSHGAEADALQAVLDTYRKRRLYVSQNALFATPHRVDKPDDQVAAVLEIDGNQFDLGATWRAPSETQYSGLGRTDVLIETNHFLKRTTPPDSGDSWERYQEINRRIAVATDASQPDNPTGDGEIDAQDARWIMQGPQRSSTLIYFLFEPNSMRIQVAFQTQEGVSALENQPTDLTWEQLFP